MKIKFNVLSILLITSFSFYACNRSSNQKMKGPQIPLVYPSTAEVDTVDTYFGTTVNDPYRWLEDDNSEETKAWVKSQNDLNFSYLNDIPYRDLLRKRLEEVYNYKKLSSPRKIGDYFFYYANDGLQNQSVIYYKKGEQGEEKVFIDPNKLSDDGTVSIGLLGANIEETLMAYSYAEAGSDWQEIRIRNIATNTDMEDRVQWVKFSGASWYKDGFFYSRYPEPKGDKALSGVNEFHAVYYH